MQVLFVVVVFVDFVSVGSQVGEDGGKVGADWEWVRDMRLLQQIDGDVFVGRGMQRKYV